MDMTVKKSPDWFTVDLKPCQLKPKRQKKWQLWRPHCRQSTAPVIYCSICLSLRGQLPPDLVKMKRTSESATWVLKMCRNFFFYFLIYVPLPLESLHDAPPSPRGGVRLKGGVPAPPIPRAAWFGGLRLSAPIPARQQCFKGGAGATGVGWGADLWAVPSWQCPPQTIIPWKFSLPGPRILIKVFIPVSTFSANFPWKGLLVSTAHRKFCAPPPQPGAPGALTQWPALPGWRFQASQVQPGVRSRPVFCLRMLVLPLKCFLNLWKFFF